MTFSRAGAVLSALAWLASLQAPAYAQAPLTPDQVATLLAEAKAAVKDGRPSAALQDLDRVRRSDPSNRDAAQLLVQIHAETGDVSAALRTYDTYVASTKKADAALLAEIARSVQRDLAAAPTGGETQRLRVLRDLARAGDKNARAALVEASSSAIGPSADIELARLGDQAAARRLAAAMNGDQRFDRTAGVVALREAGTPEAVVLLTSLLRDREPLVRSEAAEALAALGVKSAIPALQEMLKDPIFAVRLSAGTSLKRLGAASADALIGEWLASDLADVRLIAAGGFEGAAGAAAAKTWTDAIRPLLDDPNPLTRLHAAERLLSVDRRAAQRVLVEALDQPNPAVRSEAARIISAMKPADLALLRRLLTDNDGWVRCYAAAGVAAAAPPAAR